LLVLLFLLLPLLPLLLFPLPLLLFPLPLLLFPLPLLLFPPKNLLPFPIHHSLHSILALPGILMEFRQERRPEPPF
jgi:hypothetical protein